MLLSLGRGGVLSPPGRPRQSSLNLHSTKILLLQRALPLLMGAVVLWLLARWWFYRDYDVSRLDSSLFAQGVVSYDEKFRDLKFTFQVSREELGAYTWPVLHTIAGAYPEQPTAQDRKMASQLLQSLTHLYPCKKCREHFTQMLREFPPKLDSRAQFSQWLCEAHNRVNARLGKQLFPCARVSQAWPPLLKGDCGCGEDEDGDESARLSASSSSSIGWASVTGDAPAKALPTNS